MVFFVVDETDNPFTLKKDIRRATEFVRNNRAGYNCTI